MTYKILKHKLAEDLPRELIGDYEPMSREQIADHFIKQFLARAGYSTIEKCFDNYAYMITSIVLSWRSKTGLDNAVIN